MKHEYENLMERICASADLQQRVLSAARQEAPEQNKRKPVWRAAVCAALALALVVGGVTLGPQARPEYKESAEANPVTLPLTYTFGLTAYAAEQEEPALFSGGRPGTVNGSLLLGARDGGVTLTTTELDLEALQYTRYRFRVGGENVERVTLSINQAAGGDTPLGAEVTEDHDPDAIYGRWVPLNPWQPLEEQPHGISLFDGAELTVTAHFTDGRDHTRTYTLTAQRLQTAQNENGAEILIPALEGDEGSVSGLYVEPADGVWLCWPVEGSHTVSLSNRYGFRVAPGGQGGTFHTGIDIPAERGTPVLAADDGVVTEAGFDAGRGNYLAVDHGGGMETVYAHCQSLSVKTGDTVAAGQEIAAVGATGMATGPHLHFEVRQSGEAQNPVAYFDSAVRDTLKMG